MGGDQSEQKTVREAFRCGECGWWIENSPSGNAHASVGDYCMGCGRQFTEDDRYIRTGAGTLYEFEEVA